ncbi:unnamed protein product [Prorocentrum cordatum]|uniref:Uncharacterized protein n=1 Tax=Prorocentrum cordatum TaxID=2364126 RepID=A0ABN9PGZ3_9DINO|nr:unnamed protein product [Polarella glacialis]
MACAMARVCSSRAAAYSTASSSSRSWHWSGHTRAASVASMASLRALVARLAAPQARCTASSGSSGLGTAGAGCSAAASPSRALVAASGSSSLRRWRVSSSVSSRASLTTALPPLPPSPHPLVSRHGGRLHDLLPRPLEAPGPAGPLSAHTPSAALAGEADGARQWPPLKQLERVFYVHLH